MIRISCRKTIAALVASVVMLAAVVAMAGEYTIEERVEAEVLVLSNLAGEITVRPASGDAFEIVVHVRGEDAEKGVLEFDIERGRKAKAKIVYPVESHRTFIYPAIGRSNVSISPRGDGDQNLWRKLLGLSKRVKIRGKGSGLEVWADVKISMPAGASLKVYHGAGEMSAAGLRGDILLDNHMGNIVVIDVDGDVSADTGSGGVEIEKIVGDVLVDTGSGSVRVDDVRGDVHVDTGSGSVEGVDLDCRKLVVDTGSGGIELHRVGADAMRLDTGSGSVEVDLLRMGDGRFVIDTGSGGIRMRLPADASAEIEADTGSGGIKWDLDDPRIHRRDKDHVEMTLGDGRAEVVLDTGSGSIRVLQ